MAHRAIRSRASSGRAGVRAGAIVDDARCGGAVMARLRIVRAALAIAMTVGGAAACRRQTPPDAYGNVEATEVVVGAEAAGRLVSFGVNEGDTLTAGASVGA